MDQDQAAVIHCVAIQRAAADHSVAADRYAAVDRCAVAVPIWEADRYAVADRCAVVDHFVVAAPIVPADRCAAVDRYVVAVWAPVVQAARNAESVSQCVVQVAVLVWALAAIQPAAVLKVVQNEVLDVAPSVVVRSVALNGVPRVAVVKVGPRVVRVVVGV